MKRYMQNGYWVKGGFLLLVRVFRTDAKSAEIGRLNLLSQLMRHLPTINLARLTTHYVIPVNLCL